MSADQRRVLLIDAALRVIAQNGVSAATTRAIVAEAGMSLASFHYVFRSHAEMMRELVAHVVDAEVAAVFAAIRPGGDIREVMRAGLQAYLDYLVADPGHEQVMQEIVHYAIRTPGLEHLAGEQYGRYHGGVTQLLTEGAHASNIEWSLPVSDVARLVVTVTDGVTLAWLADRDTAAAHRVLDAAAGWLASLAVPRAEPARSPLDRIATATAHNAVHSHQEPR